MLLRKSSRSFSPSLPTATLSVSPEKDYVISNTHHCCQGLKIEALSLCTAQRGPKLYDNSLKLLHIVSYAVCVSVCACTQSFSHPSLRS